MLVEETFPPGGVVVRAIYANLGMLLGGKAAAGLVSLLYMVIAARTLGPTQYGVLVLVNYFAMLVGGLIAFPGWHAIVRYGLRAVSDNDHGRLVRLLRFAGAVELLGGLAAVVTAAIAAPILGPRLGWSSEAQALALPYSFAVLATVRATPAGFLQIIRRFDILGFHNVITPLMRLAGTLVVVFFGWGLTGFLFAWLIAALVEGLSLWVFGVILARRYFGEHALLGAIGDVRAENVGLLRFMATANADTMFTELAGRVAPLIMGWALGPAAAGLYSIAHRTTVVIAQPAQILGQAAYAELSRLAAREGAGAAVRRALARSVGIALIAASPVLVILALFPRQVSTLVAGPAYAGAAAIMTWLAFARVVSLCGPPTSAALIALGRPGLSVLANSAVNLGLLPLLPLFTAYWGLSGAGMHALLQALAASLLLSFMLWRATRVRP